MTVTRITKQKCQTHLNLAMSQVQYESTLTAPVFLQGAESLQFLNVSFCKISSIDCILARCPNIRLLNASNNVIERSIQSPPLLSLPLGLQGLLLGYNLITDLACLNFDHDSAQRPCLRVLDLSYNKLVHVDQIPSLNPVDNPYVLHICVEGNDAALQIQKASLALPNLTKVIKRADLRKCSAFGEKEVSREYFFTTRLQMTKRRSAGTRHQRHRSFEMQE